MALVGRVANEQDLSVVAWECVTDPHVNLAEYDVALLALDGPVSAEWARALAKATLGGCQVRHVEEYLEETNGRVSIEHFELDHVSNRNSAFYGPMKRLMDIGLTLVALPFALLIGLIATILILATMGWPVFFTQERVGLGSKTFRMWKLRTMRPNTTAAAVRAAVFDEMRITSVGRLLRRTRVDELPQLWNVLRGDMSLVGPRPEALDLHLAYVEHAPAYIYRNLVRPGITGWAQVTTTPSSNPDEARRKLSYDLFYVKRGSVFLDLQIIGRTVGALLRSPEQAPDGARASKIDAPLSGG